MTISREHSHRRSRTNRVAGIAVLGVLVAGGLGACGGAATNGTGAGTSTGTPPAAQGDLNPATLGQDLQTGLTASLNDPTSNDYNDPNGFYYQAGEAMGPVSCVQIMPASNDQFSCYGYYTDTNKTQWTKTVQVSADGTGYQTIS